MAMHDLAFHQLHGVIRDGDLHPGGAAATQLLLDWLSPHLDGKGATVLEVGAGIGNTAKRMAQRGWSVVAMEPDPVLFGILRKSRAYTALNVDLLRHGAFRRYDAVLAESVLFMNDLDAALRHIHQLLRPGGFLAFVEAVWTKQVSLEVAAEMHDRSLQLFGIPVASRRRLTWNDWNHALRTAGFRDVHISRVTPSRSERRLTKRMLRSARRYVAHPGLLRQAVIFRRRIRSFTIPADSLEAWAYLGTAEPSR